MVWYDTIYDIFNCNWVATRWQSCSTHIHTNNTENDTKQTIHRTTQKFGRVRAVPRLCGFYPGNCLTTEEKARKNLKARKKLWDVKLKIYLRVVLRLRICGAVLSRLHTPSKHTDNCNPFIFVSKPYGMPPYTLQGSVLFDVQEGNCKCGLYFSCSVHCPLAGKMATDLSVHATEPQ